MSEPLWVEIIAYAPTAFYHCMYCEVAWQEMGVSNHFHKEQIESSLPADLAQDYQVVSDEGFYKSLRYRVGRHPAVIVDHQAHFSGGALGPAGAEIERRLSQREALLVKA